MKLKIFVIHDSKAEAYIQPFFQSTYGLAERMFTDEANNPESNICKHSEDFTLFYLGEFDQETGLMELEPTPKAMSKAIDVKE